MQFREATVLTAIASLAIFPSRRPWRAIADEMKAAGVPYSRQAQAIGMEWSTFCSTFLGARDPRHADGEAFLRLVDEVRRSIAAHSADCRSIGA